MRGKNVYRHSDSQTHFKMKGLVGVSIRRIVEFAKQGGLEADDQAVIAISGILTRTYAIPVSEADKDAYTTMVVDAMADYLDPTRW